MGQNRNKEPGMPTVQGSLSRLGRPTRTGRQHDASQLPHGQAGRDARARHSSILLPGLQRCSCLVSPRISRRLRPSQWRGQRDSPTQTCQDWHRFRYIADGGQMSKRVAKELSQARPRYSADARRRRAHTGPKDSVTFLFSPYCSFAVPSST